MLDLHLMIVEDDEQLRTTLSKILSREISIVNAYAEPLAAIESLNLLKPDIIITDIKMPGMTGLEMIEIIKDTYSDIPVIVLSAFSESAYFMKAIDLKVNHFLTKPVDIPNLIEMIEHISLDLSVKRDLAKQRTLLKQYKHIVDVSSNITITDKKGILTYVNDKFCTLSGYSQEELIGHSHNIVRHLDVSKSFYKNMWQTILNKQVWQGIIKNRAKNGADFFVETTIAPILDENNVIVEFISIKTDITSLILNKKQLQAQIITDRLTGLPNRIKLQADLRNESEATLIVFDINHFKEINLLFGVKLGDEALIYMADTISTLMILFKDAGLYRISADEFVIRKSGNYSKEFEDFAHTLNAYIEEHPFNYNDISFDINFTCSIAYKSDQTQNLLEAGLDALDSAKKANHFLHFFDEGSSKQYEYEQNFEWSKKIKEALQDGRIRAYFQPIYDLEVKKITKYECLVRLIEEDGTVVSPYVFLTIAKRSRLYKEITKTVITQGCKTFADRSETVTINMSIEDLLDEDTIDFFIHKVAKNKLQGRVIAEVLESEGINNFETFSTVLKKLQDNGIRIAIDDFGSGYSNFSYLVNLELDILKIDGSLIKNVNKDANSKIIVQSIAMFAHELGMQTVAEFVSDKDIFDTVKGLGINFIQGYYISEPLEKPLAEKNILKN